MRGWRFAIVLALVGAVLVAAGWPGHARSGSSGKAAVGRDGLTAVFVPAGALDRPTRVTAEALDAERLPPAPAGSRLLGAGRFGPHGLRFAIPARITLALEERRPAGTTLRLLYLRGTTYQALDRPAVVNPDGRSASAGVEHFSVYAVAERLDGVEDGLAAWEDQAAKGNPPSDQWCDWARAELERAALELAADQERWRQASQQPPRTENANRGVTAAWARRMREWKDDLDKAEARLEELRGRLARLCPS